MRAASYASSTECSNQANFFKKNKKCFKKCLKFLFFVYTEIMFLNNDLKGFNVRTIYSLRSFIEVVIIWRKSCTLPNSYFKSFRHVVGAKSSKGKSFDHLSEIGLQTI